MHVDHFVETNLAGFYYLAQAFGGVEVCLKPEEPGINAGNYTSSNLYDFNSGFNAVKYDGYNLKKGGAQYLHLSAPQALAFVRERDNLAEGDIDRTRRQQAVIDYVIWQLKHENAFAVGGTITGLLSAANQYLITDQHLNLLDFATDMQALSGQHLSFTTLPSVPGSSELLPGYGSSPQSVNIISVPYIKRIVHAAFYPPPAAPKAKTTPRRRPRRPRPPPPSRSTSTTAGPSRGWPGTSPRRSSPAATRPGRSRTRRPSRSPSGRQPGVLRRGRVGQRGQDRDRRRRHRHRARDAARRARGGPDRVDRNRGARGPRPGRVFPRDQPEPVGHADGAGRSSGGGTITVAPNAKYGIPCVYLSGECRTVAVTSALLPTGC